MTENKLDPIHQIFIVQQLAMFERGVDVQEALKGEFDIEISLPAISWYNITNPDLPKKFKQLFTKTRNDFLKDASKIPISHKSYRLKILNKQLDHELSLKPILQNKKAQREILKQAAEESGDALTNKQKIELTGKDGEQLKTTSITVNVVQSASVKKDESDD